MPLMRCQIGGKSGWKFGGNGKCYTGVDAKKKAIKQAIAIGGGQFPMEKNTEFQCSAKITKVDEEKQLVFGWASVSVDAAGNTVFDSQDDTIDIENLEEAVYKFNLDFRKTGEMHQGEPVGDLVESFVVTPEKLEKLGMAKNALPLGWWVGFKIHDKTIFEKVKYGTRGAFSIQGQARRRKI